MLWKEVKTWATSHGYKVDRSKVKDQENSYNYVWETTCGSGLTSSTFDLAKEIYNNITSGTYINHQLNYNKDYKVDNVIH